MNKISIVIIDDHTLLRQTWSFILNSDPRFHVMAESGSAEEGIELCKKLRPDIVMLDINLPGLNGMDAVPFIRKFAPATKILGVSLHNQTAFVKKMMQSGALGYVTKNSSREEMILALVQLNEGKKYLCTEIKNNLAQDMIKQNSEEKKINSLSLREIQIINFVKQGLSSKEIASTVFLSVKTVEVHRYNILRKLNLRNAAELVNYINRHDPVLN